MVCCKDLTVISGKTYTGHCVPWEGHWLVASVGFNLCPRAIHEWIRPHFHKNFVYSTGLLITTIKANSTTYTLACALPHQQPRAARQQGVLQGAACKHLHPSDGHFFDYPIVLPFQRWHPGECKDSFSSIKPSNTMSAEGLSHRLDGSWTCSTPGDMNNGLFWSGSVEILLNFTHRDGDQNSWTQTSLHFSFFVVARKCFSSTQSF